MSSVRTLSVRALNRALLARQMLLERAPVSVPAALEHLVGMQAQAPNAPYAGLWTRLDGFRPERLSRLVESRRAVRIALMRSTIHLVTARDCLALRPVVQPVIDRSLNGSAGRQLAGVDFDALAAHSRRILEESPRTLGELGELLSRVFPRCDPVLLSYAARARLPLVQIPPRGVWGASGRPLHQDAGSWLGRPLAKPAPADRLIRRYLGAFGPATLRDMQVWSGLPGLRAVVERLRPSLMVFHTEAGQELFDLPDAPRPDQRHPAPPRFLPEFDNILLAHGDRRRIVPSEHHHRIYTGGGMIAGTVLLDGFVSGIWRIERTSRRAAAAIELLRPVPSRERQALRAEALGLLGFAVPGPTHEVRLIGHNS